MQSVVTNILNHSKEDMCSDVYLYDANSEDQLEYKYSTDQSQSSLKNNNLIEKSYTESTLDTPNSNQLNNSTASFVNQEYWQMQNIHSPANNSCYYTNENIYDNENAYLPSIDYPYTTNYLSGQYPSFGYHNNRGSSTPSNSCYTNSYYNANMTRSQGNQSVPQTSTLSNILSPETLPPINNQQRVMMNNNLLTTFHSKLNHPSNSEREVVKKYKCNICFKSFSRPSSLTTHIYSHTGEKPFKCLIKGCERRFSVVSNLRRHGKVHMKK